MNFPGQDVRKQGRDHKKKVNGAKNSKTESNVIRVNIDEQSQSTMQSNLFKNYE